MLSKISITKIVRGHWRSLRTTTGTRIHVPDVALFYGLPIVLGAGLIFLGIELRNTDALLNLAGILFGFLSAIYFFVLERFQTGSTLSSKTHSRFLDEVRHNVGYATIVLMALMVLLVLPLLDVAMVDIEVETGEPAIRRVSKWLTGPVLALCLHFILTMLMIIKRVHSDV